MIIKVCGLKSSEDALFSVASGANTIGVNFYPPSPRFVSDRMAERICADLEGRATRVGVFVGWPQRDYPYLDVIQIHGLQGRQPLKDRIPEQEVWIACAPEEAPLHPDSLVVIDTSWGQGILTDWSQLPSLHRPFVLSGGLNVSNVGNAIRHCRPAGIDVCTGVESSPGQKDRSKIQAFLEAAQAAQLALLEDSHERR